MQNPYLPLNYLINVLFIFNITYTVPHFKNNISEAVNICKHTIIKLDQNGWKTKQLLAPKTQDDRKHIYWREPKG